MKTELSKIKFGDTEYFIDFRLREIRPTDKPFDSIPFEELNEDQKAIIRGVRFRETNYNYIKGLDD